jgi:site-specific DNA-cytosine methylase/intein/homing endonuclease
MTNKNLTLGSLFDGSGGFPLGGLISGITPVWASEIEPFPIHVTTRRLPFMKHYGDISQMDGGKIEPVDIITFGSPCQDMSVAGKRNGLDGSRSCLFYEAVRIIKEMRETTNGEYPRYAVWENVCFHGDTYVTCDTGYKRIKDVCIGDRVKTHTGRYMPVVKVHQTQKQEVLKLKVGGSEELLVTPNHPFLTIKKKYSGASIVGLTSPEWTPACELTNKHLVGYRIDTPTLPENFMTEDEAWAVGRWIADGSVDLKKSNPRMFFSIGIGKEAEARKHLGNLPYAMYENKPHSTATNFCFTSHEFYAFIADAGKGAGNKKVPAYVFQLPFRLQRAALEGYISGDGYVRQRGNQIEASAVTASRELAYGIARLIRNVYRVAASISVTRPKAGNINGRELKVNYPSYIIYASLTNKVTPSIVDGDIIWQPVKSVEKINEKITVYNLSVLEDNTYAANDIIVHNCGAFSSNGGEDFKAVLEAIIGVKEEGVKVPMPEKARWSHADCYMGDGWSVAYRVLDAQYWGVPQRRKRIYLVADFAGGSAFDILFKSEGLSGYSAESFRSWQRTAGDTETCPGASGFDGYNGSLTENTAATLGANCGMSTGRNGIVLNDQGGNRMDVTDDVTSTLRAEAHHPPCVMESAGFCTEHSAKSRSIGYEEECSPTLRAGVVPAAVALENHPTDSRVKFSEDGTVQTLTSRMGTGGNNVPLVMKIRAGCEGGGKGPLIQENKSATLSCNNDQTLFEPCGWDGGQISPTLTKQNAGGSQRMPDKDNFNCVLQPFGICSKESNSMKSDNPHSGIYEADTSRTLDGNGGNPSCNQGGIAVVESYAIQGSMIGRNDKNGPQGDGINEDVSFTLNTVDRHAVYAMTTGSFTQVEEDTSPTIMARDYKDPNAVCYRSRFWRFKYNGNA